MDPWMRLTAAQFYARLHPDATRRRIVRSSHPGGRLVGLSVGTTRDGWVVLEEVWRGTHTVEFTEVPDLWSAAPTGE
jgi:hypothetical protein